VALLGRSCFFYQPLSWFELSESHRSASRQQIVLGGRAIFYVSDVDSLYEWAVAKGLHPKTASRRLGYMHVVVLMVEAIGVTKAGR
jgi:hypothetical protein